VHASLEGHPKSNEALLQSSSQLQAQLEQMNQRVAELNNKYAALVEAMRK
jgi:predicted nuclease with TOPRIM domain